MQNISCGNYFEQNDLWILNFADSMWLHLILWIFYCHELGLVIELDGSQHSTEDAIEYDAERTKFLEALGFKVVRYWNNDILSQADVVLEDLWQICHQLKHTSP